MRGYLKLAAPMAIKPRACLAARIFFSISKGFTGNPTILFDGEVTHGF